MDLALAENGRQCRFFVGAIFYCWCLVPSAAVECKKSVAESWRGGVGWKPGVVTAGHSHTSPSSSVEIRSETRCGFICPRTDKKSSSETGEPTAALRGSILSPQEVVTLFWNQRPIILGHIIVEYIRTPIILSVTSFKEQRTTG